MDIIRSRSEASLKLAARQQQGQLAGELRSLRKQLVDIVVNLEAVIDYPEEDIEDVTYGRVQESLSTVCSGIEHLLAHAHTGKDFARGLAYSYCWPSERGQVEPAKRFATGGACYCFAVCRYYA